MTEKIERMELEAESKDKVYFVINYTRVFIMIMCYKTKLTSLKDLELS